MKFQFTFSYFIDRKMWKGFSSNIISAKYENIFDSSESFSLIGLNFALCLLLNFLDFLFA